MCYEGLAFGSTDPPGISGARVMEYKFPHRGPASRDTRFLVHGRRLFRDPGPGAFQGSASRNISFSERPRGTSIRGHGPVNLEGVRGESEWGGRKKRERDRGERRRKEEEEKEPTGIKREGDQEKGGRGTKRIKERERKGGRR